MAECCGACTTMYAISVVLLMAAYGLSTYGTWACNFFKVRMIPINGYGYDRSISLGIFTVPSDLVSLDGDYSTPTIGSCFFPTWFTVYDSGSTASKLNEIWWSDTSMNIARGCVAISNFISFLSWIIMWCGMCCGCYKLRGWRITFGIINLICCILTGISFLALNNDIVCNNNQEEEECSLSLATGGIINIVAMIFFVASASLCFSTPNPGAATPQQQQQQQTAAYSQAAYPVETPVKMDQQEPEVLIETTEHLDGTVVTKKTTTNPDGTKTVEETTQKPV